VGDALAVLTFLRRLLAGVVARRPGFKHANPESFRRWVLRILVLLAALTAVQGAIQMLDSAAELILEHIQPSGYRREAARHRPGPGGTVLWGVGFTFAKPALRSFRDADDGHDLRRHDRPAAGAPAPLAHALVGDAWSSAPAAARSRAS